jgi:hypothetical protein
VCLLVCLLFSYRDPPKKPNKKNSYLPLSSSPIFREVRVSRLVEISTLMMKMILLLHEVLVVSSSKHEVLVVVSLMWKAHMKSKVS